MFFIGYSVLLIGKTLTAIPWIDYQAATYDAKTYSVDTLPYLKRDIYFIILDGYARADILQEMYGFNNFEFLAYLEKQGFVVPIASTSNYPATHLSVASMLNMDYIESFSPGLEKSYQRWLMSPFIDHSRVRALLEQQGYRSVSISTNWSITDNPTTNTYFQPDPMMLSDFEGFLLDSTPLNIINPILDRFASVPSFESQRKIILYNFETLAHLPELPGPKFVVAHIISPHPPFVFDRNGKAVQLSDSFSFKDAAEYSGSKGEYRRRYVDQLQFVNDNMERVIEAILAKSKLPPIIVIQADHGSGMLVDFASSKNTCIKERFSTFAAYYLPNLDPHSIPPSVSAVNIFRIIFNEYFAAQLPILESKLYFYKRPVSFYEFEDVTTRQNEKCQQP